ncbi:calcium and integrin-binding family member 2-like isoform X2 [Toxorhynchites rutilus septentrionalis]|uniref:calcium and integrin-binding family member 2-like isoform X2 n=1 Tax=Toxorhynchites rutilus septentrionalis TaxID=329112 RepID=UPI002479599F|nr:calcium and integrin-binding family member 2-like isoform X2 [Toxorhynchites rutilus septentrionalis]
MGAKKSILTSEQLDEYVELTYLTRWEILLILEKFLGLAPEGITRDLHQRFPHNQIMDIFPQLKCSFEDILDMFSVMSKSCPHDVKAAWAFRVFDLDNDDMITKEDIVNTCDRLTNNYQLQQDEMENIADVIIMEMDLQNNGSLGQFEFIKAISKVPEFHNSFSFRP